MTKKLTWKSTQNACYIGYISQAIIVMLPTLLFTVFRTDYGLSFAQLSVLIALLFIIQIVVDFISAPIIDKIGYRRSALCGFALCFLGLIFLSVLPRILPVYPALIVSMSVASMGSGCMEVLISPITESLPRDDKGKAMSFLHSFYCWGCVAVIALSSLFLSVAGTGNWFWLPCLWAVVPLIGFMAFLKVPLYTLVEEEKADTFLTLIRRPVFWLLFLLMICAGASEQAMSQWVSLFAEQGLGVSKAVGDLLGPCLFAAFMGSARVFFGLRTQEDHMPRALVSCAFLCIVCYLGVAFSRVSFLSLLCCAVCGFSVGVMWPGTFTIAGKLIPTGGTVMFALLAMGGDIGCSVGPALVGAVADRMTLLQADTDAAMKTGFLWAVLFPLLLIVGTFLLQKSRSKNGQS